ncbi:MAG: hypothetical protein ABI461_16965 [Polyangiaceae bacterium]
MLNIRSFASLAIASASLVVACSSSSSGSSVSADTAENDLAKAFCAHYQSCASLFVQLTYGDSATCEARFKLSIAPSLTATGTGATPGQYETCSADIASASCADLLGRNLPKSCQTVAGTLADGAACGVDAQCKDKLCRKATDQDCGVCSSVAAAGGACVADGDCDIGLTCTNKVCTAYGAAGSTCDDTHTCNATLTCNNGTCAAPGEAGAACPALGTAGCDLLKGFFCNATKVCAQIGTAKAGQPCGLVSSVYTICTGGGLCKGNTGITPGTCEATAADGAACDDTNGPPCLAPATCTNGACKITDPSTCK